MSDFRKARRAYEAASAHRSLREQEAEVFRRANASLRRVQQGCSMLTRVKAMADNDRLWQAVMGSVKDPANQLPEALRGSIVSVGLAVQREMRAASPDIAFLIDINENLAAGLSDRP